MMVGTGGQLLERSLVDRMVYAPERLVFEGAPILEPPLVQDQASRRPEVIDGHPFDTRATCLDLTIVEKARLRDLRVAEVRRLAPDAEKAKSEFIQRQAIGLADRTGCSLAAARNVAERQTSGALLPDVVLPLDTPEFDGVTVRDVLAHPERFVGATLADPLEGPDYGRCKAKIMRRKDGSCWIKSFAHGHTKYELKHDAASMEIADGYEIAIRSGDPTEASDRFVRLLLAVDLTPAEEQRLRDLASELSGIKARALGAKVKAAREQHDQERAQEIRNARADESCDERLRLSVPLADGERLPILRMLDEVLSNTGEAVPPIRDIDGHPVEVRCRPPVALHELSADGSNAAEPEKSRLPPPALPLLTRHTKYTLSHEIERHITFCSQTRNGDERQVALPPIFVEHYLAYRDSTLPRVATVLTAPLVLPDGTLLAPKGLDQKRQLVFLIHPALAVLLPNTCDCDSQGVVADALEYLTNEWLCDVSTDFPGKCVLIAMALTILERVLLPERPAFFVTAGKRGGGKTTALRMLMLAVTGQKPAAVAWSSNEEERRKAMLAHLSEGLAALVWDNIALGTSIAWPTLEKVLTTDAYTDRVLGVTVSMTVPAHTVMSFTGNNIMPAGDLASRSLITRLDVDRPDPENRTFKHADPVTWTLNNRGEILACLYTILLGNPQLQPTNRKESKTRFKVWWHLVGSAMEHAAKCLVEKQMNFPPEWQTASPIDFAAMFAAVEGEDEDTGGLSAVLDILHAVWPEKPFQASDVANLITNPMQGEEVNAANLRSYFETPSRRGPGNITPKSIGKRLAAMLGAPVWVEGKTMKLVRVSDDRRHERKFASWFHVRTQ
jgi:hypothetical protein